MSRRERLVFLLENFMEVEDGLQDNNFRGDGYLPRMCRAWNHPSYRELRRCVYNLRDAEPVPYWNLAETYFRADRRRVAWCPRCERSAPVEQVGDIHRHGQKTVALVPKMVKRVSKAVDPTKVEIAVTWIDGAFKGEPFIPDDLLPLAA